MNIAAGKDNIEILQLLLEYKADPNSANLDGIRPLHRVCRFFGYPEPIEMLLNAGALWDVQDNDGGTILHWAVRAQNEKSLKFLLEHETVNVNVNSRDVHGNSPLHESRISCSMLDLLLRNGGDMNLENNVGDVPALPWACLGKSHCMTLETLKKLRLLGFVVQDMFRARIMPNRLEENCEIYEDELKNLQKIFLSWNPRISLADLCFMNEKQLVTYTKNQILRDVYEKCGKNFESEFRHFGFLLNLRIRKALERRKLVNSGIETFNELIKSRMFDDFYDKVFSYLSKNELKNLIDCTAFCKKRDNGCHNRL